MTQNISFRFHSKWRFLSFICVFIFFIIWLFEYFSNNQDIFLLYFSGAAAICYIVGFWCCHRYRVWLNADKICHSPAFQPIIVQRNEIEEIQFFDTISLFFKLKNGKIATISLSMFEQPSEFLDTIRQWIPEKPFTKAKHTMFLENITHNAPTLITASTAVLLGGLYLGYFLPIVVGSLTGIFSSFFLIYIWHQERVTGEPSKHLGIFLFFIPFFACQLVASRFNKGILFIWIIILVIFAYWLIITISVIITHRFYHHQ